MKKAFFRLLGLVLGLNVFTACYGPAPGGWEYDDADQVENTDQNENSEEEEEEGQAKAEIPA